MKAILQQLLSFKPEGFPKWIFVWILGLCLSMLSCAGLIGLWFVSTQIQFM